MTFALTSAVALPDRFSYKRNTNITHCVDEGVAKLDGRDKKGRIRIFARAAVHRRFVQVCHNYDYMLASEFVRQLETDKKYRYRIIREAILERKDGETWK